MKAKNINERDSLKNVERKHLYVEWKDKDSIVVLGKFSENKLKRIPLYSINLNNLKKEDIEKWLESSDKGVLLFYHGLWGQQPNVLKKCLYSMEKMLVSDTMTQTVISFIWNSRSGVKFYNWKQSVNKGESMGKVTQWIIEHFKYSNVLCHSMGSRFFQGVLRNFSDSKPQIQNLILFSPDLDNVIEDNDFINCIKQSKQLIIYMHKRDRTLLFSSIFNRKKRLGRSGPNNKPENGIIVIDMTRKKKGLHNHTHFNKKWGYESIGSFLKQ